MQDEQKHNGIKTALLIGGILCAAGFLFDHGFLIILGIVICLVPFFSKKSNSNSTNYEIISGVNSSMSGGSSTSYSSDYLRAAAGEKRDNLLANEQSSNHCPVCGELSVHGYCPQCGFRFK